MVEIVEYINIRERMDALGLERPANAVVLPRYFDTAESSEGLIYPNEAKTIHSLIRQAGIDITPLEKEIFFKDEQSFAFVTPLIFFASTLISQNPHLIDMSINLISEYVYDRIRGTRKNADVKLEYVIETKSGKYKKINYEGPIDGLKSLPEIIKEIHND